MTTAAICLALFLSAAQVATAPGTQPQQPITAPESASIRGRVIDADRGKPIRLAQITLTLRVDR